jgi:hypothetical protein
MENPRQFTRHYTVAEAVSLLPLVRAWLVELRQLGTTLGRADERNAELFAEGRDLGGERINELLRSQTRWLALREEFTSRGLQIEDLERGRIGFPSLRGDSEVLLSWEEGEDVIEFWHDPGSGHSGRERL